MRHNAPSQSPEWSPPNTLFVTEAARSEVLASLPSRSHPHATSAPPKVLVAVDDPGHADLHYGLPRPRPRKVLTPVSSGPPPLAPLQPARVLVSFLLLGPVWPFLNIFGCLVN